MKTKECENCRGYGSGARPGGAILDCEVCDGEGEVCTECGSSRCLAEGQHVDVPDGLSSEVREAEAALEIEEAIAVLAEAAQPNETLVATARRLVASSVERYRNDQ